MAGADAKVRMFIKELEHKNWWQRAEALDRLAKEYGEGFADVVRRELQEQYPLRLK